MSLPSRAFPHLPPISQKGTRRYAEVKWLCQGHVGSGGALLGLFCPGIKLLRLAGPFDLLDHVHVQSGYRKLKDSTRAKDSMMRQKWQRLPRFGASLEAQLAKNTPAMQETGVWFQGREDPLEKEMATHSSVLVWEIPRTEEPIGAPFVEVQSLGTTEWLNHHHPGFVRTCKLRKKLCGRLSSETPLSQSTLQHPPASAEQSGQGREGERVPHLRPLTNLFSERLYGKHLLLAV